MDNKKKAKNKPKKAFGKQEKPKAANKFSDVWNNPKPITNKKTDAGQENLDANLPPSGDESKSDNENAGGNE